MLHFRLSHNRTFPVPPSLLSFATTSVVLVTTYTIPLKAWRSHFIHRGLVWMGKALQLRIHHRRIHHRPVSSQVKSRFCCASRCQPLPSALLPSEYSCVERRSGASRCPARALHAVLGSLVASSISAPGPARFPPIIRIFLLWGADWEVLFRTPRLPIESSFSLSASMPLPCCDTSPG